jgi:putative ABC transport system permease protein
MDMEGHDPRKNNEVSVSINTARDNNINMGDYMHVYIKDKKYDLLVVGIYQSMNNMGRGIRLYEGTVKEADPDYVYGILISLKDSNNINSYIKDMKDRYGEKIDISDRQNEFNDQISSATGGSFISVMMILLIMLSICFLNIFNIVLMNINEERKIGFLTVAFNIITTNVFTDFYLAEWIYFLLFMVYIVMITVNYNKLVQYRRVPEDLKALA